MSIDIFGNPIVTLAMIVPLVASVSQQAYQNSKINEYFASKLYQSNPFLESGGGNAYIYGDDRKENLLERSRHATHPQQNWIHYYYNHPLLAGGIGDLQQEIESSEISKQSKAAADMAATVRKEFLTQAENFPRGNMPALKGAPYVPPTAPSPAPNVPPQILRRPPTPLLAAPINHPTPLFHPVLLTRPMLIANPSIISQDPLIYLGEKAPLHFPDKIPLLDQQQELVYFISPQSQELATIYNPPGINPRQQYTQYQMPLMGLFGGGFLHDMRFRGNSSAAGDFADSNKLNQPNDANGLGNKEAKSLSETTDSNDMGESKDPHAIGMDNLDNTKSHANSKLSPLRTNPFTKLNVFGK